MKGSDTSSASRPAPSREKAPGKVAPRGAPNGSGEQKGPDGEIAALLRLAALDADLLELEAEVQKLAARSEEHRYAVAGLQAALESDRRRLTGAGGRPLGADLATLRRHVQESEKAHAQLSRQAEQSEAERQALAADLERRRAEVADEQTGLRSRLSAQVLETYRTALRSGRGPAIVKLVQSVCSGCHMRLHSKLEDQIRRRWGMAACPHCRRLVYDPSWLEGSGSQPGGRA